jgi:predicted nuclease of restriction endonuclease-like (RecB) superfamily
MSGSILKTQDYKAFVRDIKQQIQFSQIKAAISVNQRLLKLYWDMADRIVVKQKQSAWGDGFLTQLSKDLQAEFPDMKGFSLRNIKYMKQWFDFWSSEPFIAKQLASQLEKSEPIQSQSTSSSIGQQVAAQLENSVNTTEVTLLIWQIPWWHNVVIITKIKSQEEALFYVQKTIENNWSRAVLTHQIEAELFKREGNAQTNFQATLPKPQSDLAQQIIKDPYTFDFLNLREKHDERELENALASQVTSFLLELGAGFSFIARQYRLTVEEDDFYIDLLLYHVKLHCYVVVELKAVKFQPEFTGKLNFYISAVDGMLKTAQDNPTIGILICKSKNKTVVEYALKDMHQPIGVSAYTLTHHLPEEYKSSLPTIEEIEAELGGKNE